MSITHDSSVPFHHHGKYLVQVCITLFLNNDKSFFNGLTCFQSFLPPCSYNEKS